MGDPHAARASEADAAGLADLGAAAFVFVIRGDVADAGMQALGVVLVAHAGELARQRLELLAAELDQTWPDAAGSLREGLHDTLTLMRLGSPGSSPRRSRRRIRASR